MSFQDIKISEYFDLLSSNKPAPGGGSALGLTLQSACSLCLMVCNLTLGKKGYEQVQNRIKEIINLINPIMDEAIRVMDDDAKAFNLFMDAYKAKDEDKINESTKFSIEVPYSLLTSTNKLIPICEELIKIGNKNVVSDAMIALDLSHSIIPGCKLNIEANLKYLKDNKDKYEQVLGINKSINKYQEFSKFECVKDSNNPYSACYILSGGEKFYVEPVFHLQLQGMKQRQEEKFEEIINEIIRLVKKNKLVVFVGDEDNEITNVEGAIYLTIQDVCDPLCIFVEDKSRGSDYGD